MIIGVDGSQANARVRIGIEWYGHDLLHALARVRGEETYRLYLEGPLRPDLSLGPGFTPVVLSWPTERLWHQTRLSLEMLARRPDVFFAPAHVLPLIHPRRTVTTVHDIGFEEFPALYPRWERGYQGWALRHALKAASRIIVPSHFTKSRIAERFPGAEKKITVIHHGFTANRVPHVDHDERLADVKARYRLERPFVFYVGGLGYKKNIPHLVRAFCRARALRDWSLVLAGKPDHGYQDAKAVLAEERAEGRVQEFGLVPGEDLPSMVRLARIFAFPSRYEGFGVPVLEAFQEGTPVLISRAGALPEIAGDAALQTGVDDLEEMTAALERLATDQELRTRLVQRGRERLKAFSWERTARETREVLLNA